MFTDNLNEWWKSYEKETVFNRAVPNIMDGMKPVHRKIFYTALQRFSGKNKFMNTNAFSGAVKEYSNYHHGDLSLTGTITKLTAEFRNNLPMFIGNGNFGNRLMHQAAAARYTEITINKNFTNFLVMPEILNYSLQDDKEYHDPDFYFFSIPMVLVNGLSGIAVGIKTDILSYNVDDIKKNIKRVLQGKKQVEMTPLMPLNSGLIKKENDKWIQYGKIEKIKSNMLKITEIPSSFNREKYIAHLQKLKESNTILDYVDKSSDGFEFDIKVTRNFFKQYGDTPYDMFKLKYILTENIVVLSPDGNTTIKFDSPEDLIEHFVGIMLKYIDQYINFKIDEYINKINRLNYRSIFIEYVLGIDIRKFTYIDIINNVIKLGIPENIAKEFMGISILGLTKDSIIKQKNKIIELNELINELKSTTPTKMYIKLLS